MRLKAFKTQIIVVSVLLSATGESFNVKINKIKYDWERIPPQRSKWMTHLWQQGGTKLKPTRSEPCRPSASSLASPSWKKKALKQFQVTQTLISSYSKVSQRRQKQPCAWICQWCPRRFSVLLPSAPNALLVRPGDNKLATSGNGILSGVTHKGVEKQVGPDFRFFFHLIKFTVVFLSLPREWCQCRSHATTLNRLTSHNDE